MSIVGYWKNQSLRFLERRWVSTEGSVCSECVSDAALKTILRENEGTRLRCDFCCTTPATNIDALLEAFLNGLLNEYEDALDGVSWDGREGGYLWHPQWVTWELVGEFEWVFASEKLLDTVRTAVHDITWVEKDFVTRRSDDVLIEAWSRFCEIVKHETRYIFWRIPRGDDPGPGEISAVEILDVIAPLIEQLDLVRVLPAGYRVWRSRTHGRAAVRHSASELGTVPKESALIANRMSPAGIPMFYGSLDAETAIEEATFATEDSDVTWCQFELTADLPVVDLTRLPVEPSMFDPKLGSIRREIRFLNAFVTHLCARVQPDQAQIDYVPTQMLTEYLLRVYGRGDRARGLVYQSSIAEGSCVVLDIRNDHCIDAGNRPGGRISASQTHPRECEIRRSQLREPFTELVAHPDIRLPSRHRRQHIRVGAYLVLLRE